MKSRQQQSKRNHKIYKRVKENEKTDFSSNHGSLREYDSTAGRCACGRRWRSPDRKHAGNGNVISGRGSCDRRGI